MESECEEDGEEVGGELGEDFCSAFVNGDYDHAEYAYGCAGHDPLCDFDHDVV